VELVARLAAEQLAILLVSHDLETALAVAHRVAVMRRGRIVATRACAELDRSIARSACSWLGEQMRHETRGDTSRYNRASGAMNADNAPILALFGWALPGGLSPSFRVD
jgi:ABC-type sugar transport system ATPase subunit